MAQGPSALGDYLRARREQLRPEDVGLVAGGQRRAPDCAARSWRHWRASAPPTTCDSSRAATNPSAQVVDALAGLYNWTAKPRVICTTWPPQGGDISAVEVAAHGLAEVIDQFLMPAIVVNRYRDILAANPIARALSPEFTPGQNSLRWRLLEPAARELYVNWDEATGNSGKWLAGTQCFLSERCSHAGVDR